MKDIDGIISTKGFGSAIVKQNKKSVKLRLFRPLTESEDYTTKIIEKVVNTFYDYKIK